VSLKPSAVDVLLQGCSFEPVGIASDRRPWRRLTDGLCPSVPAYAERPPLWLGDGCMRSCSWDKRGADRARDVAGRVDVIEGIV